MDGPHILVAVLFAAFMALVCGYVCGILIWRTTPLRAWWYSPRVLLFRLGGVTTLRRKLNYRCTLCHDSMDAGDKVRTLSCDHVFHCGGGGGGGKCASDIDEWLRTARVMSCPLCRQTPRPVLPWKRPPPSSPAVTSPGSSAPTLPPQTSSTTQDLEEALLLHHPERDDDDTPPPPPPEASSSSASAPPPLAQLPSVSDLEEASPALAEDEEIVPWVSSSSSQ